VDVNKDTKGFSPIEHVTHLASMLMSVGDVDVYSKTYEELVRSVRASGKVPPDWDPPSADVRYEYKWDVPGAAAGDQVFGPYSEDEMKAWHKAAYFGANAEKVKVRTVGGQWGSWDDVVI
jgi:CD2 antigen cytoplasmic tail-binding protein 2